MIYQSKKRKFSECVTQSLMLSEEQLLDMSAKNSALEVKYSTNKSPIDKTSQQPTYIPTSPYYEQGIVSRFNLEEPVALKSKNWREFFTVAELNENYMKIENGIDPNEDEHAS